MKTRTKWAVALAAAALCGVLSLYRATDAAPRGEPPFGNSVEQRMDQINYLKEISELLKEQNRLLREQNALLNSGKLQVVVTLPEK
ncbi:MAG: hypothetical protein HUU20_17420 [Pirellulales bacterium]|nr:hypothetical protein [Pirellulales bacterium]